MGSQRHNQMRNLEIYAGAALLGVLAGMRSMAAPATLGQLSRKGALAGVDGPLALVTSSRYVPATSVLAIGELIADKLPFTQNRTAARPLLGRALTGAFSGAVVCSAKKRSVLAGALIGGAAAVGAAYGAYELRKQAVRQLHLPDTVVALAEDALVGATGAALVTRLSSD
jgi:uncharacterized membrane protein